MRASHGVIIWEAFKEIWVFDEASTMFTFVPITSNNKSSTIYQLQLIIRELAYTVYIYNEVYYLFIY